MSDLIKAQPGEEVEVTASYLEGTEIATADDNGILRDSEGRAYSAGAYEVIEE